MTETPLFANRYNPDILSCIANLSNDAVFTPPNFANTMLDALTDAWKKSNDGANIWADPTVRFLDPATKTGVFLREIVSRLNEGLSTVFPDRQERVDHILSNQVFGIGTENLTALMSRRSVYCSKKANGKYSISSVFETDQGNIWFERTEHTWEGGTQRVTTTDENGEIVERFVDGKCRYCNASQLKFDRDPELESHAYAFIHAEDIRMFIGEIFGENMYFDVIIGNPPYQLEDGGYGSSSTPIYHKFIEQAKTLEPRFISFVVPARWMGGGKGLDQFREVMLNDKRIRILVDYLKANEVFPDVDPSGGICYFLWDSQFDGTPQITTKLKGRELSHSSRPLLEPGAQAYIRYDLAVPILQKISSYHGAQSGHIGLPDDESMASQVSPRKPFGLATDFVGHSTKKSGDVTVITGKGKTYLGREKLPQPLPNLNQYKVLVSYAAYDHGGNPGSDGKRKVFSKIQIAEPGEICTETYLVVGSFSTRDEAENLVKYMTTRFFRFLISLTMYSHHITRERYLFVPIQDFSIPWSDKALADKYQLTEDEVALIESLIRPMEVSDV